MAYLNFILQFIEAYDCILLPLIALSLVLFGVVNWSRNVYRKNNKKIAACCRKVASYPHKTAQYVNSLPAEYRRQWRAYQNSKASKPSLTFEFVPLKRRIVLVREFCFGALLSALYVVAFAFDLSHTDYLIFQIVFWLGFALALVVNKLISRRKEYKAKQIFAKLVAELNRSVDYTADKSEEVDNTVKKLQQLNKCEVTGAVLTRASELLRSKGLDTNRSAAQQRKLNLALNGLLQSYAKTPPAN